LKIFKSHPLAIEITEPPGTVLKGFDDELRIATAKGALCIEEIQGDSGKRLLVKDFLRGNRIPIGSVLG
jgi:methionyl-tRNA formyltransferase